MQNEIAFSTFKRCSVILTDDHFVYTSGLHGGTYVNKDALYPHTKETGELCQMLAEEFRNDSLDIVLAPAMGGIILSQWVAHHLSEMKGREVLAVYAEKTGDGKSFLLKRGYDKLIRGKNVLVVEDILNTGGSIKKVIEEARSAGGHIIGLGALCNRGNVTPKDVAEIPKLIALVNLTLETWNEKECPLCKDGIPINTKIGKGGKFFV